MNAEATLLMPQAAAWLTLVLLLSGFLASAAWALETLARRTVPTRVIWAGALLVMVGMAAVAPLRVALTPVAPVQLPASVPSSQVAPRVAPDGASPVGDVDAPRSPISWTASWVANGVAGEMARHNLTTVGPRLVLGAAVVWGVLSLGVVLTLIVSYRRLVRRIAAEGEAAIINGTPVLVSAETGPVVAGLLAPRIVVPRWLLDRPSAEQSLVVAHELSHISARDPWLLILGTVGVALLPWNPFSWWFMSRLRLAIEMDCDHRVLRRADTSARTYGRLLIECSAAAPRVSLATPAFSHRTTHLERRLRTMTTQQPARTFPRRLGIMALGSVALLAACESQIPTAAEVATMNVAALEQRVGVLLPASSDVSTRYFIDGVASTREAATALTPDQIATIEVRRVLKKVALTTGASADQPTEQSNVEMYLTTKAASGSATNGESRKTGDATSINFTMVPSTGERTERTEVKRMLVVEGAPSPGSAVAEVLSGAPSGTDDISFIIIDGVRADKAAMQRVSPADIVTIEIVKGPAAVARYGESAAKGVIVVTTKGAPK